MRPPNFLFIGPDKTGSSWLFEVLSQHPECFVPACKDIYFFDRYHDRGLDWYFRHFADASDDVKAIGELSHDYLFSAEAAHRIACELPNVRILSSLRNPVDRTFSHYLYMVRSGRTQLVFEDALKEFPELIDNSLYCRHLSHYCRLFPQEKIKIVYFESLQLDPLAYAREIFDFLEVSFVQDINYAKKIRIASKPRNFQLAHLVKRGASLARDLGFGNLVGAVKHSRIAGLLYKPYDQGDRPQMRHETRLALTDLFATDVGNIELELGLEVPWSEWKKTKSETYFDAVCVPRS